MSERKIKKRSVFVFPMFLVSGFSKLSIGLGCGCSRRFVVQNAKKIDHH